MSRADFFTLERKKTRIYSDFLTSFARNPTTGNLAINENEDSVKRSLRNLVLTNVGERFYDSNKGSRIKASLFELYDLATVEMVKMQLRKMIEIYEPRANPFTINFVQDLDNNAIRVQIIFQIINIISEPIQLNVVVQKVR